MDGCVGCLSFDVGCGLFPKWTASKILEAVIFLGLALAAYLLHGHGGESLQAIKITDVVCDLVCYRYFVVYKLMLAIAIYHGLMALFLIGVRSYSDDRSVLQDAFWPLKAVLIAGCIIGCLFMPRVVLSGLFYPALIASLMFGVIQSVIMVDMTYAITGAALDRGGFWMGLLITVSVLFYGLIGFGSWAMFTLFKTTSERAIVIGSAILTLLLAIGSVLPVVRKGNERSGLFQASIIGLLSLAIISAAIIGAPANQLAAQTSGLLKVITIISRVLGGIFCLLSIIAVSAMGGSGKDAESEAHEYNYSLFHAVFMLAAFFVVTIVTDWQKTMVEDRAISFYQAGATFFAQISVAVIVNLIYIWTLVAPIMFPSRKFDF